MKSISLASTLLFGFAACGGSDLDPGSGDDPGSGTSTLQVNGSVRAEPRLTNARNGGEFTTEISVRIQLNGQDVTAGSVTVTSSSGGVVLAYDGNGRWRGDGIGYDEVYVLDVDSGNDNVHDVRVDGPSIHVFAEPQAGANVDASMPLLVKWSSKGADSASVDAENLDRISVDDTGSYMLAAHALKSEKDKPRENQITIARTNRVTPAGATAGSELSVTIENDLTVIAMPDPLAP
jgi:hypothetical protein